MKIDERAGRERFRGFHRPGASPENDIGEGNVFSRSHEKPEPFPSHDARLPAPPRPVAHHARRALPAHTGRWPRAVHNTLQDIFSRPASTRWRRAELPNAVVGSQSSGNPASSRRWSAGTRPAGRTSARAAARVVAVTRRTATRRTTSARGVGEFLHRPGEVFTDSRPSGADRGGDGTRFGFEQGRSEKQICPKTVAARADDDARTCRASRACRWVTSPRTSIADPRDDPLVHQAAAVPQPRRHPGNSTSTATR